MKQSFESMKEKLEGLNLYDFEKEGSNIKKELELYASEFDFFYINIGEILWENFISKAYSYGIENREKIWGAVRTDLPMNKRRKMILERLRVTNNDFSPEHMQRFLTSINLTATIVEMPSYYEVYINCTEGQHNKGERAWIEREIKRFFPAHLTVYVDFRTINWDQIDAIGATFSQMDAKNYTWKAIEEYGLN